MENRNSARTHPAVAGFDRAAPAYEVGRPEYPADAVRALIDELEIGPGRCVLDVGAGTGKLTRSLRGTGARLLAVEPTAGMRAEFSRQVPDVPVVDGTAESLPLDRASVDAIVVGQAFHWFRGPETLAEFGRVLRPRGGLGLIWNLRDDSAAISAGLTKILDPYDRGVPRVRTLGWKAAFVGSTEFDPLVQRSFAFVQTLDPETFVARAVSVSFIADQPPVVRADIERRARRLLDELAPGAASVELPYRTEVYLTRRR